MDWTTTKPIVSHFFLMNMIYFAQTTLLCGLAIVAMAISLAQYYFQVVQRLHLILLNLLASIPIMEQ